MNNAFKLSTLVLAATTVALPSAVSAAVLGQSQLHGTVTAFDGRYDVHVQTRSGEIDDVTLHRGTIINPTGLTLRPGMHVTILGNRDAATFDANEIDTPYHVSAVLPAFGYGPGGCDSRYFGRGFDGPLFTSGFVDSDRGDDRARR